MKTVFRALLTLGVSFGLSQLVVSSSYAGEKAEKKCDAAGKTCKKGDDCKPENCKKAEGDKK